MGTKKAVWQEGNIRRTDTAAAEMEKKFQSLQEIN